MAFSDVNELTFDEGEALGLDLADDGEEDMDFATWHSILLDTLLANIPRRLPAAE